MKNESIQLLKDFVLETHVDIGEEYKKKENIRKSIQDLLQVSIISADISSKEDLVEWWKTFDMASNTLRMIPFETWKTILNKR